MSDIAVGPSKGHSVQKMEKKPRPSQTKGRISKRTAMVREVVSEVVGLSPYEKRLLDMLKTGGASAEKRMYKFAKRRLGTHKRALKKREQVKDIYGAMRAKQASA